jgi:glyoxylase-like metal-dependent hydrolase (beta-lactamase superfamily II)
MTRHDGVMVDVCETCGAQFEQQPEVCPICDDPRQWVPEDGQRWTTREALAEKHDHVMREDGAFEGVGVEPAFAIGQRALLVPHGAGRLMWDCVPLVGDAEIGGLTGIAISHPHYYTGMVDWAQRYDCPVYLHADDREWITRSDRRLELWEGETLDLGGGLTLIRCGGHFAGGTVLHAGDALLAGDIVQVIPDRGWVGFMYSYPNLIPLPEAAVRAIAEKLEPYEFDAIYGAWWDRIVRRDGTAIVQRSAERYARALRGELP